MNDFRKDFVYLQPYYSKEKGDMKIIDGPAGGIAPARMLGPKVEMAGRKMFLPNSDVKFVIQDLTLKQIKAIPKDRFTVEVIVPTMPVMSNSDIRKGHGAMPSLRKQQRFPLGGKNDVIGLISKAVADVNPIDAEVTKTFKTLIMLHGQEEETLNKAQELVRQIMRNQKDDPQPDSGIFFELINENELANCIQKIIKSYFGIGDTCKIMGQEYTLGEFCVLMHFYFIRIGIMENQARKPFSDYLQKKVFDGEDRFTAKTFNNYANKYEDVEGNFTHADWLPIDFETRPKTSGKIQDAFHEIGYIFHNSQYFKQLKKQQDRMKILLL